MKRLNLTPIQVERLREYVRSDTPNGFEAFYALVYGRRLPRHARAWIDAIYTAHAAGQGIIIKAFRRSAKTTTITNAFAAYRMCLEPDRLSLLVQVGDGIAADNSILVGEIVKRSPGKDAIFPYLAPDPSAGWGAGGYDIIRTDMPYSAFKAQKLRWGKDPSLIGVGYQSGEIIGKHPSGVAIVDDINNERNTASHRRNAEVNKIVQDTIFPTFSPNNPWEIFVGTPWVYNDVLSYVESTGEYVVINTPVMEYTTEGSPGAVWYPELSTWVVPAWPEIFPIDRIEAARKKAGVLGFARMYMLDLAAAQGKELKLEWLHEYPASEISAGWPVVMGVDFASTADKLRLKDRDFCAVSVGRLIPGGGIILVDGWRGHVSTGEAQLKVSALAQQYGRTLHMIGIETQGKGEEFFNAVKYSTSLPVWPFTPGNRSKGYRFQEQMAPAFQFSRAWISDEPNEYLGQFKDEWAGWMAGAPHDDTLDATYYMLRAGAENMMAGFWEDPDLPELWDEEEVSPFAELGSQHVR